MPAWRALAIRCALIVAGAALAVELAAGATLAIEATAAARFGFDVRSVVVATLATAVLSAATFYAAYEGFDDNLRRRH